MMDKFFKFKNFIGPKVWRYFLISPVIGAVWFAIEYSFIFIIQGFLSSLGLLAKESIILPNWCPTSLRYSIVALCVFGVIRSLVFVLKGHFATLLQLEFTFAQRKNLFSFGLKNPHLISNKEIVATFTEVISQSGALISNATVLINTTFTALFFFIAGARLVPYEMTFGIVALGLFLLPLKFTSKKIKIFGKGLIDEWSNSSESLLRGLRNNFFLSIYNRVDNEIASGNESFTKHKNHFINYSLLSGLLNAIPMLFGIIVLSLITFVSSTYFKTDSIKLISFFYLFTRLAQTAGEASGAITRVHLSLPSFKLMYEWDLRFRATENNKAPDKITIQDREVFIEAKNLGFQFSKERNLFRNINFTVKRSDILLIKGESGAGKSTLLSLILGLYAPTEGELRLNSLSTHEHGLDLHKVLAYVGPEPYLIQGTVRENLTYGMDSQLDVSDVRLWEALEALELKELILNLPRKLDEPIHDIAQLSTGQKQRLSFARALARDPSLLILDEATANLDSVTEKKIINNLSHLFKNCTSIIVSHKSTFDEVATHTIDLNLLKNSNYT